ncbi:MAG: diaminopimelate epimerase [Bacillota bacterium]
MILHYVKVNPAQNMTVFILDQVPRKDHARISRKLMGYDSVHAEQVGFIEKTILPDKTETLRLQMMGGEFCGNASRSFASYMVLTGYPSIEMSGNDYVVPIEVSGLEKNVECLVTPLDGRNHFRSRIQMPLPKNVGAQEFVVQGETIQTIRVDFYGITHFVVDQDNVRSNLEFFNIVKSVMDQENYEAFGVMFYSFEDRNVTPLVYVRDTDTICWEKSCASGTAALGVCLSYLDDINTKEDIQQPGGVLHIQVDWEDGKARSIHLDGEIEIVSEGTVYVDIQE